MFRIAPSPKASNQLAPPGRESRQRVLSRRRRRFRGGQQEVHALENVLAATYDQLAPTRRGKSSKEFFLDEGAFFVAACEGRTLWKGWASRLKLKMILRQSAAGRLDHAFIRQAV